MKQLVAFTFVLNSILIWQNCRAAEEGSKASTEDPRRDLPAAGRPNSRDEPLTGTYPRFNGTQHALSKWENDSYLDPKQFNSFANQLDEAGYATAMAGDDQTRNAV